MSSQVSALPPGFPNPLQMLLAWRERRFASACCQEMLALHQVVAAQHPGLSGELLYRKVVETRLGDQGTLVDDVLQGARVSYANWPIERELMFRDVVHYLAVSGYCRTRGRKRWLRSDIVGVIDAAIPAEL